MFTETLIERAAALVSACRSRGILLASAESCTGGLLAALLTEIAGSSAAFDRGFVTYSNAAKQELLGVPGDMLARFGAVSAEVASAMALGAIARSGAAMAVAVTGIAGPDGGSDDKPVGLVHFGLAIRGATVRSTERRFGDVGRGAVRLASVHTALELLETNLPVLP